MSNRESADSRQETQQTDVLILGIGNILLSDEGAGVKAVWQLQQNYRIPEGVEVLDGGTSGMELLSQIDNRQHLYVLDSINSGEEEPGSVTRIDLSEEPGFFQSKVSPHQLGLSEVLAVTRLTETQPRNIVLYGIRPANLDTGTELSPAVQAGMQELLQQLVSELRGLGLEIAYREGGGTG